MSHKVIRITTISGIECCSICGQPAEIVRYLGDKMQHKSAPISPAAPVSANVETAPKSETPNE